MRLGHTVLAMSTGDPEMTTKQAESLTCRACGKADEAVFDGWDLREGAYHAACLPQSRKVPQEWDMCDE